MLWGIWGEGVLQCEFAACVWFQVCFGLGLIKLCVVGYLLCGLIC